MGNQLSQDQNQESLEYTINYIAARYIRSSNFTDMVNLTKSDYCKDTVILTAKVIKENLKDHEIEYLAVKKGIDGEEKMAEEDVVVLKKSLNELDVQNSTKKERMCKGLAKHYIQIANIFAAISMTINPIYHYIDDSGNKIDISLVDKGEIPKDKQPKISRNSLCSTRFNILVNDFPKRYDDK